ncbi:MAG: CHRD domain-containing protein [Burkholderiaceae bacterium]
MKFRLPLLAACAAALLTAVSVQAAVIRYEASLTPEVSGATGSGFVTVDYDTLAKALLISADWSGLSGTTTVAHIHCCTATPGTGTAGVAVTPGTLPNFPTGLSTGSYDIAIDLGSAAAYTPGFITNFAGGDLDNADDALIAAFDAGTAYFNIHTNLFPAGEIRGFLQRQAQAVPEPASWMLLAPALALLVRAGGRRRRGGVAA